VLKNLSSTEPVSQSIRSAIFELLGCVPLFHPEDALERTLEVIDVLNGSFTSFMENLLSSPFWQCVDYPDCPYKVLCIDLAQEIDRMATQKIEPAYHSRRHFKDVCLMISYLLMQESGKLFEQPASNLWVTSPQEKWLLLLAAIAHDFHHPGLINRIPYEIEKNSLTVLGQFLSQKNMDCDLKNLVMDRLYPWVMATDPAVYAQLLTKVSGDDVSHENCLAMLLVEADLFASSLPIKGQILATRLAKEWRVNNPDGANAVDGIEGRLTFLRKIRFISPYAIAVGAEKMRLSSINKLEDLKFRD